MAWRPARSLEVLKGQIQATYWWAAPPATSPLSWGMLGDPNTHDATSDHMAHDFPGWGNDIVTAHDFPHRPDLRLDAGAIVEAMRRSRDARIKYVIFNRRLYSSYSTTTRAAWSWGTYSGSNPHTDHAHVSVVGDARADGTQRWTIGATEVLTPDQEQMLKNLHEWMFGFARGLVAPAPGTPHVTEYVPNRILKELESRTPTLSPTDAQFAELKAAISDAIGAAMVSGLRDAVVDVINTTRLTTGDE